MNEDRSTRYHRLKRWGSLAALAWGVGLLVGLLWSRGSVALRNAAEAIAGPAASAHGWRATLAVATYVVLLSLVSEIGALPLAFYTGFLLEHRYALSNERIGGWLRDQAKSFAVGLLLGCGGAGLVYALIRVSPDRWWLPAGTVFALLLVVLTNLAPVLLLPLFYRVKPLDRESLRARLLALAERAGARVLGAYEWGLADKTKKANAALAGLGRTRRILVSDTMLAEYSDEEIEVILAHEMAHHVHGDIWKGIVFESALVVVGCYIASRVLGRLTGPLGLRGPADIAGLPLLLLVLGAVSLVTVPLAHAMSRTFERSADRFALDLTRNPKAFISAMRRLGTQNLAEEDPSRFVQWLFYTHPPVRERIAAAEISKSQNP